MKKPIYADDAMKTMIDTSSFASQFFQQVNADPELQKEAGVALSQDEAAECQKFLDAYPNYEPCATNWAELRRYLARHNLSLTAEHLASGWIWMQANRRAKTVGMAEREQSSAPDYQKIDQLPDAEISSTFESIRAARRAKRNAAEQLLKAPLTA